MNKFIKIFKTINNRKGGLSGVKKVTVCEKTAVSMSMLEDCRDVIIMSYKKNEAQLSNISSKSFKLRKKNKNKLASKLQINNYTYNNKKVIYFSNKNKLYSNLGNVPRGSQVFAKSKN